MGWVARVVAAVVVIAAAVIGGVVAYAHAPDQRDHDAFVARPRGRFPVWEKDGRAHRRAPVLRLSRPPHADACDDPNRAWERSGSGSSKESSSHRSAGWRRRPSREGIRTPRASSWCQSWDRSSGSGSVRTTLLSASAGTSARFSASVVKRCRDGSGSTQQRAEWAECAADAWRARGGQGSPLLLCCAVRLRTTPRRRHPNAQRTPGARVGPGAAPSLLLRRAFPHDAEASPPSARTVGCGRSGGWVTRSGGTRRRRRAPRPRRPRTSSRRACRSASPAPRPTPRWDR